VSLGEEVFFERGRQRGVPLRKRYFAAIGSYRVKTVADMYRRAAYHNKH